MKKKTTSAIALLLLAVLIGCQSATPSVTTVDEFSSVFRAAYDSGDKDAIGNMFDWTDVDSEVRELQLAMVTMFLGENKITDISVAPFDPNTPKNPVNGREIELNIAPAHMFSIEHKGNAGFEGGESSGTATMPIGQKNGRYYFCGWTYKESQ